MIRVNLENIISDLSLSSYQKKVKLIDQQIKKKTGPGHEFLGWHDLPIKISNEDLDLMNEYAQKVRANYEVLVVCGIGGSYLGARTAIEALRGLKSNDPLEIIFFGQTFSSDYTFEILRYLGNKNFAINVISKSGTTTETAIAFRLLKNLLEKKIGKEKARQAIFVTTDATSGALKKLSLKEGYRTFVLPSDIGGRYSILTPVGLFPIACAGLNIKEMVLGAIDAFHTYNHPSLENNEAYKYAIARDYLYQNGKSVELFVLYEPKLLMLGEWLKQLFGESEGKMKKGLFPASVSFSTDLHSLGQFIQDGTPLLFETIIHFENANNDVSIPFEEENLDGLNYLANKTLNEVNTKAFLGTLDAHVNVGQVPNIVLELETLNEKTLGHLFYFFMKTCAMSSYLLDVNPFNQPGVEVYKEKMFELLGKKKG